MDIYGLAGVHLQNPNYGLGYNDAAFMRAEQNAMVRGWIARLKAVRVRLFISRTLRNTFKGGLATFVAYLIAHESHHRGGIVLTLKQAKHPLSKDDYWKIWGWSKG